MSHESPDFRIMTAAMRVPNEPRRVRRFSIRAVKGEAKRNCSYCDNTILPHVTHYLLAIEFDGARGQVDEETMLACQNCVEERRRMLAEASVLIH